MRFREIFTFTLIALTLIGVVFFGWAQMNGLRFSADEVNRDDAKRKSTQLLTTDQWIEYQILPEASSFRLLTNAALNSTDAPDNDLSSPRVGWRYAIEYQLMDQNRNLIKESVYHFRSEIRQLKDNDSGKIIYPLFFGRSGLVATQTRTMQLAVGDDKKSVGQGVAILRARLLSNDPQVQEVVARAIARVQRPEGEERKIWGRFSGERRERVSKYCVYGHDLLTIAERNSLLKWRWVGCPTLGEFEKRFLFFIGDVDDEEIRSDQTPLGTIASPGALATIAIPEGKGRLRMEVTLIGSSSGDQLMEVKTSTETKVRVDTNNAKVTINQPQFVDLNWFGVTSKERLHFHRELGMETTIEIEVEGGLLQLEPSTKIVARTFWTPLDELARQTSNNWEQHSQFLLEQNETLTTNQTEFEITPRPIGIRTFLTNDQPVEYRINHLDQQPTPLRIKLRYPLAELFGNNSNGILAQKPVANWQFLGASDEITASGTLTIDQQPSLYDWMSLNSVREPLSNATEFYLSVPPDVQRVRIQAEGTRVLVNAYVRPNGLARTVRIPEDSHAFYRFQTTNRSWFGLNPVDHSMMIRDNRSFVVSTQVQPAVVDETVLIEDFEWVRFLPAGRWIGRQLLIPREIETEMNIREQAFDVTYFEINPAHEYNIIAFKDSFNRNADPKLIFAGQQTPGTVIISLDGKPVSQTRVVSKRGEIDISQLDISNSSRIEIHCDNEARFFLAGFHVVDSNPFMKRTAQRLLDGKLEFKYDKLTHSDELLTLRLYRGDSNQSRFKIRAQIHPPASLTNDVTPDSLSILNTWTVTDRIYDLRAMPGLPSIVFGNSGSADLGHRCSLKLGADLPPGQYTISIESVEGSSDAFVLLYQTIPGTARIRDFKSLSAELAR